VRIESPGDERGTKERRVEGVDLLTQARALMEERARRHAKTSSAAADPNLSSSLTYPTEHAANLAWRTDLARRAETDAAVRLAVRSRCKESVEYFAGALGWTFDPRPEAKPNHFPFILWPYEREFVATIEEQYRAGRDLLVEKSRDMGATWCVLLWVLHHWLFDEAFSAHLGSRVENFVDKRGDTASHFGKLRYMLERMPAWMMPAGFDWRLHDLSMRLLNPETGAAITGEAANPDFSRQGRYSVIFLDEFASIPCDESVAAATSESTSTRIFVTTPKGAHGSFYRMRRSGKVRTVRLHWSLHPKKRDCTPAYLAKMVEEGRAKYAEQAFTPPGLYRGLGTTTDKGEFIPGQLRSPWYDGRCEAEPSPRIIAQELDIEYLGSGNAVLDMDVVHRWDVQLHEMPRRVLRTEMGGAWEIYEEPEEGSQYIASTDTAKGTGGDYSVIEVFRYPQLVQVAEFWAQMPPDVLGVEAVEAAHLYNDGLLVIENDGMGLATCYAARDHLAAKGYALQLYRYVNYREPNSQPAELGLSTGKCRPEMVRRLMGAVRQGLITVRSLRWIAEAYSFEWVSPDRAEATSGQHDDLILATMFVLYATLSWDRWDRATGAWWM